MTTYVIDHELEFSEGLFYYKKVGVVGMVSIFKTTPEDFKFNLGKASCLHLEKYGLHLEPEGQLPIHTWPGDTVFLYKYKKEYFIRIQHLLGTSFL